MFRVLSKCRPQFVKPYLEELRILSGTDENRVVRIHCQGAIRATTYTDSGMFRPENMV